MGLEDKYVSLSDGSDAQIYKTDKGSTAINTAINTIANNQAKFDDLVNMPSASEVDAGIAKANSIQDVDDVVAGLTVTTDEINFTTSDYPLFKENAELTYIRSNNLIDNSKIVNKRQVKNSNTFATDGKSAVINVTENQEYWVIRPSLPLGGTYTTAQYDSITASFTDGINGTGNFIAPNTEDIFVFANTLKNGKITAPTGAKSIIITVETDTLGYLDGITFIKAITGSNFTYGSENYYLKELDIPTKLDLYPIYDEKIGTKSLANYQTVVRTKRIVVKDNSMIWVKTHITPTLYGSVVALYDENGDLIEEINVKNGAITSYSFNSLVTNVIIDNNYAYLNIKASGIYTITVASFNDVADEYIMPEIFATELKEENEINNDTIFWANIVRLDYGGERAFHEFYTKSKSGKILKHVVTTAGITSNVYGFGSYIVENQIPEEATANKTIIINEPNIAEYYSIRTKKDGVADDDWIGHGNSLNLVDIKFYADGQEVDPIADPKNFRRAKTIEIVQNIELLGSYGGVQTKVIDAELKFIINSNGTYRYTNKATYVADIELTTNLVAMQFYRKGTKSDTNVGYDKLRYQNDALVQDVTMTLPRAYYDSATDRTLTLIDSTKDLKIVLTMDAWESNHPSTANDKLSFQSETTFAKLYYFFGLGARNIGDNYLTDVVIDYY